MERDPNNDSDEPPSGRNLAACAFHAAAGAEDHLVAALDFLAGQVGSGASEPWTVKRWPLIRDQQVAWLREWATAQGCWIDTVSLGKSEPGRMEHDLFPEVDPERRMWKVTKGAGFGLHPHCEENLVSGMVSDWFTMRPGSPLQYLDRLCLVNDQVFPGMNRLEGFTEWKNNFAILFSQPFIVGRNASEAEIGAFFREAGFLRICHGTWFRQEEPLAVFDAGMTK